MAEWAEPRGTSEEGFPNTQNRDMLVLVRPAHLASKVCGGFETLRGYRRTPSRCWCWGWVLGAMAPVTYKDLVIVGITGVGSGLYWSGDSRSHRSHSSGAAEMGNGNAVVWFGCHISKTDTADA